MMASSEEIPKKRNMCLSLQSSVCSHIQGLAHYCTLQMKTQTTRPQFQKFCLSPKFPFIFLFFFLQFFLNYEYDSYQ
jgi:hypothetical protein